MKRRKDNKLIDIKYRKNKKHFILDCMNWMNYLVDKEDIDAEFPAVLKDAEAAGAILDNLDEEDDVDFDRDLNLFFKSVRVRILCFGKRDYVRIKLRTLLSKYGYKRRSDKLIYNFNKCMDFYGLESYTRGGISCTLEAADIDDMITFRVKRKLKNWQSPGVK